LKGPMPAPRIYPDADIEDALIRTDGYLSRTAAQLGVSLNHLFSRIEASPHLQAVRQRIREARLDLAESALQQHIKDGNLSAIIFFLKCQGKQRGYVERVEQAVAAQHDIRITWTMPSPGQIPGQVTQPQLPASFSPVSSIPDTVPVTEYITPEEQAPMPKRYGNKPKQFKERKHKDASASVVDKAEPKLKRNNVDKLKAAHSRITQHNVLASDN